MPLWKQLIAASLLGCIVLSTSGEEPEPLSLVPVWDRMFNLRNAFGYRDNVLLSRDHPKGSAFLGTRFETMVTRLPINGPQLNFFVSAEDIRFLSPQLVDKEQTAFAQFQIKKDLSAHWHAGMALEYLYQNQVLDVSTVETNLSSVQVKGHSLIARPAVTRKIGEDNWLSLEVPLHRQYFRAPLGDYWAGGPKLTLGRSYGHKSELSLSYEYTYRVYDDQEQLTASGLPLTNSTRAFQQHEARLTWKHHFDQKRRWRSTTRLSYKWNEDNGDGYFDYTRWQASQQLRYQNAGWELALEGKLASYSYPVQRVAFDGENRERTEAGVSFRAEKQLFSFLKLFAEYEFDKIFSNLELEEYTASSVNGGLSWEF